MVLKNLSIKELRKVCKDIVRYIDCLQEDISDCKETLPYFKDHPQKRTGSESVKEYITNTTSQMETDILFMEDSLKKKRRRLAYVKRFLKDKRDKNFKCSVCFGKKVPNAGKMKPITLIGERYRRSVKESLKKK